MCFSFGAAFYLGCVTAALAQDAFVPANVQLATRGHGWILRNVVGMTLYTYMRDPIGGPSDCKDECAEIWRPLQVDGEADAKAEADGDWSINVRDDGTRQWAFRGKPLYTYSRDDAPGDMNGDEHQRQWYVALKPLPLPPGFNSYKTEFGHLLVDQKNMTLYTPSADVPAASVCDGDCAKTWPPVEAWWRARSTLGDWSVINRADGTKQWAYKDQPLFRYVGDFQPGEIAGDGVETFVAVVLEPPPSVPDWITIQNSDAGTLLADADGKTLYAYDLPENRAFGTPFDIGTSRDMATAHLWSPVYADSATEPIGHWSVVELSDGRYQWTYKGLKLFVYKRDTEPGDLNGQRGTDR